MRQALILHPDFRCAAVTHVEVEVARSRTANLMLHYFVTGKIGNLLLPPVTVPARTDGLWHHTCLEAFISAPPYIAYDEFNFSPSTQWAAYRFDSYRTGMRGAREIGTPRIDVRSSDSCYELQVSLELGRMPDLPNDATWRLALSAVIEEKNGLKSYWALAHPPGNFDFHHSDCFALELPAA
jgi:hypothetical protein